MDQHCTLFFENLGFITKKQLVEIFNVIEKASSAFFSQTPKHTVDVDFYAGNTTSFNFTEFKANFSDKTVFNSINFMFFFSEGQYASFYISKDLLNKNNSFSYHFSVKCKNKTHSEATVFAEDVTEELNALLKKSFVSGSIDLKNKCDNNNTCTKHINNDFSRDTDYKRLGKNAAKIIDLLSGISSILDFVFSWFK